MGNDFRGFPGLKNYSGFIPDYYELKLNILSFQIKLSIVGVEIKKIEWYFSSEPKPSGVTNKLTCLGVYCMIKTLLNLVESLINLLESLINLFV